MFDEIVWLPIIESGKQAIAAPKRSFPPGSSILARYLLVHFPEFRGLSGNPVAFEIVRVNFKNGLGIIFAEIVGGRYV